MATVTYYCGAVKLKNIHSLSNARFERIGGAASKHNRFDSFQRLVGHPAEGPDAILPVTRRIEYKAHPSRHTCSARCRNATGHSCECECGGDNHGVDA